MPESATSAPDLEALTGLNRDYIRSVQNGDVRRFEEILAADFRCSNRTGRCSTAPAFWRRPRGR